MPVELCPECGMPLRMNGTCPNGHGPFPPPPPSSAE